jgi:hypothetical protein
MKKLFVVLSMVAVMFLFDGCKKKQTPTDENATTENQPAPAENATK